MASATERRVNPRIQATLDRLAAERRCALVPYITTGFPRPDSTIEVMHAMARAGADLIELGVPFSDPMADGPVIQRANERALAAGVSLETALRAVADFRRDDDRTPVVLMGYANPFEHDGLAAFLAKAAASGVDGLIIVDYPPDESEEFAEAARAVGIDPIFFLAPTSTPERIEQVMAIGQGYVYYVSLKGITGGVLDVDDVRRRVGAIKQHGRLPVGVGFGIRDGATARAVAEVADAVIIGTRMIQVLDDGPPEQAPGRAAGFIAQVRASLDQPAQGAS